MKKKRIACIVTPWLATTLLAFPVWPAELDVLTVRGKDIVNSHGHVMSMRGANFGGWLMMETWIPSIEMEWHDHLPRLAAEVGIGKELSTALNQVGEHNDDIEAIMDYIERLHAALKNLVAEDKFKEYMALFTREPSVFAAKDLDELLRRRFGAYGAGEIWNAYHDTWITERDFQLARALGFNFVRIPFWYRWFENDETPYTYHEYGFHYLDKAIAWAAEHDLYVMLDFHGAPGGQNPWDHTGELSRNEFFSNTEFQKRTAALWKHIADRYKNTPTVFAYDALNEPFSAKDVHQWTRVHDEIYRAIRETDPTTIVVMEDGYKLEEEPWRTDGFFPDPGTLKWSNVVYSFHFYSGADPEFTKDDGTADHAKRVQEVLRLGLQEQERCGVPMYIGEFSTMGDHPNDLEGMRQFVTAFNEHGWHWSPWTFKYVDDEQAGTIWGVYQFNQPWARTPNMYRDSKQSILDTIARLGMDHFSLKQEYADVLREALVQPVRSANH